MGLYVYSNPNDPTEYVEVVQGMNDVHEYVDNGVKWVREYSVPMAAVDTKFDCMSSRDFALKTRSKKDRLGDLWDRSKELSEKRAKTMGRDEVKEQYKKDWSSKRLGRKFPKFLENKIEKR